MSAWVEISVQGGAQAYVDAAQVVAVIMPKGLTGDDLPDAKDGLRVVVSGGQCLPDVVGVCADDLILSLGVAKLAFRTLNRPTILLKQGRLDALLAEMTNAGKIT